MLRQHRAYHIRHRRAAHLARRGAAVHLAVGSLAAGFLGVLGHHTKYLDASEQRAGLKDSSMGLLRASVKKWTPNEYGGLLQLVGHPCSLPFSAAPPLSKRISVGSAVLKDCQQE